MRHPSVTITFPDGGAVTYSHPDGDLFPRADFVPGPNAATVTPPDVAAYHVAVTDAIARAYLRAIARADDDPSADTDY